MTGFYAIYRKTEEESESRKTDRLTLSEDFYDNILIAERSERSRSAKGEIGFSIRPRLLKKIKNLVPEGMFENGSVLDLGSGYGAVVGYFAAVNPVAKNVIGVEFLPDRVIAASELLKNLEEKFALNSFSMSSWSIIEGDVRKELKDSSWIDILSDVTVVISNNAVFDANSNQAIISRLFDVMNEAENTRVIYVFTTAPLVNVRKFSQDSWERYKSPERFRSLDPDREASFEDFVQEVYVSPITGPGLASWSDSPNDLSLYGIRLTNADVATDGAFFDSFSACDTVFSVKKPGSQRAWNIERCKTAWKHGISVIENEKARNQLITSLDYILMSDIPSIFANDIIDTFEENLSEFDGDKFLGDWISYLETGVSNPKLAGLLGERLDILVSASFRVANDEEDDDDDYPILETDEEKTLTPEILFLISRRFDLETPLPPDLEIRDDTKMGKGIFATVNLTEDWRAQMGGEVIYKTSEKVDKVASEKGAEYIAEYRGRFVKGDIERTVWVDSRNHWSGLFNHSWNSPIPFEGHPCPKSFANAEVDELGQIRFLRPIAAGEQILWDYGTDYWLNNDKIPLWDVTDMEEDCLKNPLLREVIAGFLDISEFRPSKSFLFELQEELKKTPIEEESFELNVHHIHRILSRKTTTGPMSQLDKSILNALDSILSEEHVKLLSRVTEDQVVKIVEKILIAREKGEIEKNAISASRLRKLVDELVTAERALKKKKKEIFPSNPEREIESYERSVMSGTGLTPETNVADISLSGKEEEFVDETEADSRNELEKITRRLGILQTWYKDFNKRLSSISGFESVTTEMGKWLENKIPKGSVAVRNEFFVLMEMGDTFINVLKSLKSRIYETNDERMEMKTLMDASEETSKYLWTAFDQTRLDKFDTAYWSPISDAAIIRAGDKLLVFLQELSKDLDSTAKNVTGQDLTEDPTVIMDDMAWVFGGTKEFAVKRPGRISPEKIAPRKILTSKKTREKRALAERGEKMLDIVRSTFVCPKTKVEKELSSTVVLSLADVLEKNKVDSLYDFDVQCSLLVYVLASRHGISSRIGCRTANLYKYHDQVADFLVENELLEIRPDSEIIGEVPNFEGISYLYIHKIKKGDSELIQKAMKFVTKEMTIISLDDRKILENEGLDLRERVTNRLRPPGLTVYFHRPSPILKVPEPEKKKEGPKRYSLIDLTGSVPKIIEITKGKAELTSESITIFSQKKKEKEREKMTSVIAFGKPIKEKEVEEEVPAKASGAVTYAKSFNYDDDKKKDEYDSEEEEEESLRAEAQMDDEEEEELHEDEKIISKALAAVRFSSAKGHTNEEENEDDKEEKNETDASFKIPGFRRFGGSNPDKFLKDAQKKVGNVKVGSGSAKVQDVINDVQKLKGRAEKNANKMKWEQNDITDLMNKFDDEIKYLKTLKSQATKASGALPELAYKKFEKTQDMHVHEMQISPGTSTERVENTPHEVIMQIASGEANVNLEYTDSEGKKVKATKNQKDRQNLLIPRGASYSIDAPEGQSPVIVFISPGKYD